MFKVETVNDLIGTNNYPQLGGQVSAVSLNVAGSDRVVGVTNKPITAAFTLQNALASSNTVTIYFPNNFITSVARHFYCRKSKPALKLF